MKWSLRKIACAQPGVMSQVGRSSLSSIAGQLAEASTARLAEKSEGRPGAARNEPLG